MTKLVLRRLSFALVIFPLLLSAAKLKDPRNMTFPVRLDFTPNEVERATLSNGIEVFLIPNHELPLLDVNILVQAGEQRVAAENSGLSELLANMIIEAGGKEITKKSFEDSLYRVGASFDYSSDFESISFKLHMLSKDAASLIPLVAGAIRKPSLPASQLELNKRQYITAYQARNSEQDNVAQRVFKKLIYGTESAEAREITPENLKTITIERLNKYHKANFRPSLVMIGVTGDFEPKVMLELLEASFGNWIEPQEPAWKKSSRYVNPAPPGVYLIPWPGSVQANIRIGYKGILRNDPRYPASRLFVEIYGGGWFSRLHDEIRENRGLAYVTLAYLSSKFSEPGIFAAISMTKTAKSLEALSLMIDIMRNMKNSGITTQELELAKQNWLASFPSHYEYPTAVLYDRMNYAIHDYPIDFWDKLPDRIEPLTKKDINEFARDFLHPESLRILILGDTNYFDGSLSQFGKVTIIDIDKF